MSQEDIVREIVERHADAFRKGDVPTVMADYADDAVVITKATGAVVGKEAITKLYEMIFASVFPPATTTLVFEPVLLGGDCGLLHWSATAPGIRTEGGFDSFFIRNGKIVNQAGGVDIKSV